MPRKTVHVCSDCGAQEAKWHGQCPACGAWNTLVEEVLPEAGAPGRGRVRGGSGAGGERPAASRPRPLREVGAAPVRRLLTGIGELDRVLGGGLVPGSLTLLGGSPGIGKSTLTNMVLGHLAGAGHGTLYVSGEESAEQVRLRAERLVGGSVEAKGDTVVPLRPSSALEVPIVAETELEAVLDTLAAERPEVCVIDSVQTLRSADLSGAPGSVGQVREV